MKIRVAPLILLASGALAANEPQLTVCEAVHRAENHLQQKGVDRSGQSVRMVRQQYDAAQRMAYWEIIWGWDKVKLGMELSARVYPDGRVEWQRLGP